MHPILRLPDPPDELVIEAAFEFGVTYPAFTPPGITRLALGEKFSRLDAIPGAQRGYVDYSTLPKEGPTEEMLMLCRVDSPVTVRYPAEDVRFRLTWDTKILPSCLLWPTDRSITEPPWNGRFRGLGLEPIAAMGVATCVEVIPDRPLVIRYRIEAGDA